MVAAFASGPLLESTDRHAGERAAPQLRQKAMVDVERRPILRPLLPVKCRVGLLALLHLFTLVVGAEQPELPQTLNRVGVVVRLAGPVPADVVVEVATNDCGGGG